MKFEDASASLLGLLRTGEQSAHAAMRRIMRRLAPGAGVLAFEALAPIALDEARHDRWLAQLDSRAAVPGRRPSRAARHFFHRLHSAEPALHLARIAALDGCVCQVLSRVLVAPRAAQLDAALRVALRAIRIDESRHVSVTRGLAMELGVPREWAHSINLETRHGFANVLNDFRAEFETLGVDYSDLRARIRRDAN